MQPRARTCICLHVVAMAAWPAATAASISSSERKSPKPSIISTALSVPAIVRSRSDCFSSASLGFTTNSPMTRPICTPATARVKGMSERSSAAAAAVIACGGGGSSSEYDSVHKSTCAFV